MPYRGHTREHAPRGAPDADGRTAGEVVRFGLVGVVNTVVDYVIFITLTVVFDIPLSSVWIAKYPSSAVGMAVSFFLNRRFVFRATAHRRRGQAFRFITATLIGIFVIQNLLTQLFASKLQYFGIEAFHAVQTPSECSRALYDQDRRVRPRSRRLDHLELPRLQVLGLSPDEDAKMESP